jgi:predicted phage terminase large subunit-like protein
MAVSELQMLRYALEHDFMSFTERGVREITQGGSFQHNWHLDAISWVLMKVMSGEIKRLIINLPPRSLKSLMTSVLFPAFWLGHDPRKKIFGISYGTDLAAKHARDAELVMRSNWYRKTFPGTRVSRIADSVIYTDKRGLRKATSIGAALTGFGGDCFIIDDPLKPIDAQSEPIRNSANEWISHTLISRLDDKAKGSIIVVMQRVHQHDLTGYLTENFPETWTILNLPAIASEDERVQIGPNSFHIRQAGEALHPERESLEVLEGLRRELGSDHFAAQYQQSPVPPGGAMVRRDWLQYWDVLPDLKYPAKVFQSWDTAVKNGAQNDFSVCTTWLRLDKKFYLMDLVRGRFEYPRLKETAIRLAEKYKPNTILIEDASTGSPLAQELRQAGVYAVQLIPVERDKQARLYAQQDKFEKGLVFFPRQAPYLRELEAELLSFPQSKFDDQVDSITQALASQTSKYRYDTSLAWVR